MSKKVTVIITKKGADIKENNFKEGKSHKVRPGIAEALIKGGFAVAEGENPNVKQSKKDKE